MCLKKSLMRWEICDLSWPNVVRDTQQNVPNLELVKMLDKATSARVGPVKPIRSASVSMNYIIIYFNDFRTTKDFFVILSA